MGKNSEKSDFVYDINNFNKNWGWRVGFCYFIVYK